MANSLDLQKALSNIQDMVNKRYLSYLQGQEISRFPSTSSTRPLKTLGDSKGHPVANRPYKDWTLKELLNLIKIYEGYKSSKEITDYGTEQLKLMKEEIDIRMKEYSDRKKLSKLKQVLATDHPYTIIPTGLTELDVQQWTSWTTS